MRQQIGHYCHKWRISRLSPSWESVYDKFGQLSKSTYFPVSFSFTPIWLTRCWGHSKWRSQSNGTAVGFGLLVKVSVLLQMVPVGRGMIEKEVSGRMLERCLGATRCWCQNTIQRKAETQLAVTDPSRSSSPQIRS